MPSWQGNFSSDRPMTSDRGSCALGRMAFQEALATASGRCTDVQERLFPSVRNILGQSVVKYLVAFASIPRHKVGWGWFTRLLTHDFSRVLARATRGSGRSPSWTVQPGIGPIHTALQVRHALFGAGEADVVNRGCRSCRVSCALVSIRCRLPLRLQVRGVHEVGPAYVSSSSPARAKRSRAKMWILAST
jgi:hypothetical protein